MPSAKGWTIKVVGAAAVFVGLVLGLPLFFSFYLHDLIVRAIPSEINPVEIGIGAGLATLIGSMALSLLLFAVWMFAATRCLSQQEMAVLGRELDDFSGRLDAK